MTNFKQRQRSPENKNTLCQEQLQKVKQITQIDDPNDPETIQMQQTNIEKSEKREKRILQIIFLGIQNNWRYFHIKNGAEDFIEKQLTNVNTIGDVYTFIVSLIENWFFNLIGAVALIILIKTALKEQALLICQLKQHFPNQ